MAVARPAGPPPTMITSVSSFATAQISGHDDPVAPLALGPVQALVGARDELRFGGDGELRRRDPERGRDGGEPLVALLARPCEDRQPDALGDEPAGGGGRFGSEDDELLAAEARDEVGVARRLADGRGDFDENLVTHRV